MAGGTDVTGRPPDACSRIFSTVSMTNTSGSPGPKPDGCIHTGVVKIDAETREPHFAR